MEIGKEISVLYTSIHFSIYQKSLYNHHHTAIYRQSSLDACESEIEALIPISSYQIPFFTFSLWTFGSYYFYVTFISADLMWCMYRVCVWNKSWFRNQNQHCAGTVIKLNSQLHHHHRHILHYDMFTNVIWSLHWSSDVGTKCLAF